MSGTGKNKRQRARMQDSEDEDEEDEAEEEDAAAAPAAAADTSTVSGLKAALKACGLKVSGNKPALEARWAEALAADGAGGGASLDESKEDEDDGAYEDEPAEEESAPRTGGRGGGGRASSGGGRGGGGGRDVTETGGTVRCIRVENFMNHDSVIVDFARHLNFVTGKNGSGKSAILAALQVALGVTARKTGRGTSYSALIKNGKSSALAAIELLNEGSEAWRPEVYGDTIVIERRLNRSGGGSFHTKTKGGKIVEKAGKEETARIVDHFNIQVDNPCSVLSQDEAKRFINGKSSEKYDFFLKATGLKSVFDDMMDATDHENQMNAILQTKENVVADELATFEAFKQEKEDNEEMIEIQKQQDQLKNELAWAYVNVEKIGEEDQQAARDERVAAQEKVKEKADKKKAEKDALIPRKNELLAQLRGVEGAVKEHQAKLKQAQKSTKERKKEMTTAHREVVTIEKNKTSSERSIEDANKAIEEVNKRKKAGKVNPELCKLTRKQEQLKCQIETLKLDSVTRMENQSTLEETAEQLQQQVRAKSHAKEAAASEQRKMAAQINRIKDNEYRELAKFGRPMPQLVAAIEAERSWDMPPVGPLGRHITVNDPSHVLAVEHCLGSMLSEFLVSSWKDQKTMEKICRQQQLLGKVRFSVKRIDLDDYAQSGSLKRGTFPDLSQESRVRGMLDCITVDNVAVKNYLYDIMAYRAVVVVAKVDLSGQRNIAYQAAANQGSGIRNVAKAYCPKDGLCISVTGRTQSEVPFRRSQMSPLAPKSQDVMVEMNEQLDELKRKAKEAIDDHGRAYKKHNEVRQKIVATQKNINDNRKKVQKLSEEVGGLGNKIRDFESGDDGEMAEHQDTLEEEEANIREFDIALQDAQRKHKSTEDRATGAKEAEEAVVEDGKAKFQEQEENSNEYGEIELKVSKLNGDIGKYDAREKKAQEAVHKVQKLLDIAAHKHKKSRQNAYTVCGNEDEIETDREPEDVNAQIAGNKQRLDKADEARSGRLLRDIEEDYQRSHNRYKRVRNLVDNVTKTRDSLKKGRKKRQKMYKTFRKQAYEVSRQEFNNFLQQRGHTGDINFQEAMVCKGCGNAEKKCECHDACGEEGTMRERAGFGTLDMQVNLGNTTGASQRTVTNQKTLSGGEKSYTTLSLLMALGESSHVPFAVYDEIDVFMDTANRAATLKMIEGAAMDKKGSRQYTMLTPLNTSSIQTIPGEVKVMSMSGSTEYVDGAT